MSAASELRKEIERAYSYKIMSVSPGSQFELKTECDVDAILDAVIAALPGYKPGWNDAMWDIDAKGAQMVNDNEAFNKAVAEVRDLLQSAKTQKGEE